MTSPAPGSTVGGTTVPVSASVSIVGSLVVAGVQFKLDGANLGAEDTTAPYSVSWNTTTASNGSHTLSAVARDTLGVQYASDPITVTVFNDNIPPTVSITSPASGATVSGTIAVTANASDNVGVVGVQFRLDGAALGAEDTTAPYSVSWNTAAAINGSHTLTAVARDAAGNRTTSAPVTVTVFNDTTPPTVSITSPASGATVSGTITVTANASDNVGVVGVQFFADGAPLGAEDTVAPYSVSVNTTTTSNGSHTLTAVARDAAGNRTTSAPVTVTVFNDTTPPTVSITSPASGATVSGTITVTASASDDVGVVGVQFFGDGALLGAEDTVAPYSISLDTTTAANGAHTLTAVARDAAGNRTTSAPVTVTVFNDTTPPTVSITSPASGATVSGTITVTASASDNVGVVGVQFFGDGALLGAEDTVAPYSISLDTTTAANGAHTLTAVARDAAGNRTTSAPVTVTVSNGPAPDTMPPTVSITSPASGATVSGTITVTASASDNVGVVGVQFLLDGATLGAEDTTAPYSVSWNTTTASNGSHTLTAVARDAAGNSTTSASAVTVSNGVATVTRFEEGNAAVSPSPISAWVSLSPQVAAFSSGTAASSNVTGATATFTFTGTAVRWIGLKCSVCGIASVSVDGGAATPVDTAGAAVPGSPGLASEAVFTTSGLAASVHTLVITVTGTSNSGGIHIVVDAFDVTGTGSTILTRLEENNAAVSPSPVGAWGLLGAGIAAFSGGSAVSSNATGDTVTLSFTGTAVSWIGLKCSVCGIASVSVDGGAATPVDTAGAAAPGSPGLASEAVFTASGLAAGAIHTLVITVTGTSNSGGTHIVVDAFDVPDGSIILTRFEEGNTNVSPSPAGAWVPRGSETAAFSKGTAASSDVTGATVTFTFTGTGVSWIGLKCSICGIATASIDGGAATSVDTASAAAPRSPGIASEPVFTASGLAAGTTHTLLITVTGATTSMAAHIVVDAFDVTP